MRPPPELPDDDFATIANRLIHYANSAAQACADGELMVARAGGAGLGVTRWMEELRESAVMAGKLQAFFRDAAIHEPLIRDFFAGLGALGEDHEAGAITKGKQA